MFWGEIAPCEHFAQFYYDDRALIDVLAGFIGGGLDAGEGTIIIATSQHVAAAEERLRAAGVDLKAAASEDRYIALDAEATLTSFMVNDWPDAVLFHSLVTQLLTRARGEGRRVSAFGEMVALLWAKGHNGATVNLEFLWNQLCQKEGFSLFCAYPRSGFTEAKQSLLDICKAHTRIM
jgi:hypothetical protein